MKIRIGTRKSILALVQTELVKERILEHFPEAEVELVKMSTKGDEILDKSLTSFGGKGVFTQELEDALVSETIDLAVHSAKDMPMEFPEELHIGAVLERANPRDIFVTMDGTSLKDLAPGSIVGTSSLRREIQIKEINPLVEIKMLRGNVQTRLGKLEAGQYDGIMLAAAGLERLGLVEKGGFSFEYLEPEEFLPAAGQGILAIEAKKGRMKEVLEAIHDKNAALLLEAERSFLTHIGGSCNAPAAGYCKEIDGHLEMKVLYAKDGVHPVYAMGQKSKEEASELGKEMALEVKKGKVWLLGAGPGDTGLLSRKALECIQKADVIVYDNLVSDSLLNEAKEDAELIYAGKRASKHHLKQEETNSILVQKTLEGKTVARIKGGDPFIFGRGGEEAKELLDSGVKFEIIPGISSSYAAAAYAGIPVTHRDYASSFHVITGHESNTKVGLVLDYETLAKEEGTLVFLMGLHNLPNISAKLIANGKDKKTPVAVIQEGTTARQRVAVATLETIVDKVREMGIQTPAATIVGNVVSLREELEWFGKQPLFGRRVLLTGTKQMCKRQSAELTNIGAECVSFSLIHTKACESKEIGTAMENITDYSWIVLTSNNGVELFFEEIKKRQMDIRSLYGIKIAVIGESTKKALEEKGMIPDFVPTKFSSGDMVKEWIPTLTKEDKVILLRAKEASLELPKALEEHQISYTAVSLYETVVDERKEEELNRVVQDVDYITFASASAVKAYVKMLDKDTKVEAKIICIGPVTAKEAIKLGLDVHATSKVYTAPGMRDVILMDGRG